MPEDVKKGKTPASALGPAHVLDDLPFEWLLTATTRIQPLVDQAVSELKMIREYSSTIGKLRSPFKQLSNGLRVMMRRLHRLGALDLEKRCLYSRYFDFSDLSSIQLDETSQFNLIRVGATLREQAFDAFDDVYGALGGFALKIAATKFRTHADDHGQAAIEIEEIAFYARDTYEFRNNEDDDQQLGWWNYSHVIATPYLMLTKPDYTLQNGVRFFQVTNESFMKYRTLSGRGGNFITYTTKKKLDVSIMVHLSTVDFQEFVDREE